MERRFIAGHDIELTIPLIDQYGGIVDASALSYRIVDQAGVELVAMTPDPTFVPSSSEITLTVLAAQNTLGASEIYAVRSVELYMTTASGMVFGVFDYFIESSVPLVDGVNSFQSYAQSLMTAEAIAKIPGWTQAQRDARVSALRQAAANILRLTFKGMWDDYVGQDRLRVITPFSTGPNLKVIMESAQYASLPPHFIDALRRAQVLEANFILGGDEVEEIRRSGVMSTTVGESSQFFRTVKPLELPICRRALQEIGRYVSYSPKVAR